MKYFPKIQLLSDVKVDTQNAIGFYESESKFRKNYLQKFLRTDLRFLIKDKITKTEARKIIKAFTENFYKENEKEIKSGLIQVKKDWQKVNNKYFKIVDKIFNGYPWPRGKYTGYVSIYWMYPRWIQHKTFFFPYQHRLPRFAISVIGHEMLHFIFFDYIEKKYGIKENQELKGKPQGYVWRVSEVFNVVMENWQPYNKIIRVEGKPYEGHEKMYQKMKQQWAHKQDVDWLLDKWLKV